MQMWAGNATRGSGVSEAVALADARPHVDGHSRQMRHQREEALAVIDDHSVA